MKNYLLLGFLVLVASLTPVFAKLAVSEVSPLSLGFLRFGTAALLFYITLKARKASLKFDKQDYPRLILLALTCVPLNQFFFLTGIKSSYASHSGIIYSLNPVYSYIIAILIKSERFRYNKLSAILLTVVGIVVIFLENFLKTSIDSNVVFGDSLLLFAVLTFSIYLTFGKSMIAKYGALRVSTFAFVFGTIFNIPFFIYDLHNLTFANLTTTGIIAFPLLVLFSYLGYFGWYYALKTNEVSRLTTLNNVAPVVTVLVSIFFLGESISVYFILGGIITLIGVFLMHRVAIEVP